MGRSTTRSLALAAIALTGCAALLREKPPKLSDLYPPPFFEDYVTYLEKWRTESGTPWKVDITTIPPSRELTAPIKLSTPFVRLDRLHLASVDATKLCFGFVSKGDRMGVPADEVAKRQLEELQALNLSIRATSSLASERGKRLWPVPADATHVDSFTMLSDEIQDFDTERGTVERRRVVKFNVCAPAPQITSATKFIVITAHFADEVEQERYFQRYDSNNYKSTQEERELNNQTERLKNDAMILIAITAGAPDLTM